MDEAPPPPDRTIAEVRATAADIHHSWDQAKATGDAEALSRVHELAKEAGVPADQLEQITDGFVAIAQELIGQRGKRRRRSSFRWPRMKRLESNGPRAIAPGEQHRALPPGTPD